VSINQITIKSLKAVDDFGELNRLTDALVFIDEVYRLMKKPSVIEQTRKIDFRRKEYKEIKGAKLAAFKVNSPPEITINVDGTWLGALVFVLLNYKTIKDNVTELGSDTSQIIQGLTNLTKEEIENIQIGSKLLHDQLSNLMEKDVENLEKRIQHVRSKINIESIKKIIVKRDKNT
jgi:hypothetical protein